MIRGYETFREEGVRESYSARSQGPYGAGEGMRYAEPMESRPLIDPTPIGRQAI